MKKLILCLFAIFALLLSGCGSSGSETPAPTPDSEPASTPASEPVSDPVDPPEDYNSEPVDPEPVEDEPVDYQALESEALSAFDMAQEYWSWLDAGAPTLYEEPKIETVDGYDMYYYHIDVPEVSTFEDLENLLSQYVDRSFVESEIASCEQFREFDGELYVMPAGRGDDLTIASVDIAAEIDEGGESGKVIATIYRQDFDDETSEWYETGEKDVSEFPFSIIDGSVIFSRMEYLY